jgi:LmbE family N-acetylglucosaminyl deacetylase
MNIHQESYDAIFLSPHFDDAVLSVGGKIAQLTKRKKRALIITFFTQGNDLITSSDTLLFLKNSGVKRSTTLFQKRKKEDTLAAQALEAEVLHLNFTDALFRTKSTGNTFQSSSIYPSFDAIFSGVISPLDHALKAELIQELQQLKKQLTSKTKLYAPLGVGKHIDHLLCFESALEVFGDRIVFWEDVPYRARYLNVLSRLSMLEHHNGAFVPQASSILPSSTIVQKKAAVQAYRSQLNGLLSSGLSDAQLQLERFYSYHAD